MFLVSVSWISVILCGFFVSYSEMNIALTGLYLKGNNGTYYGFLSVTTLQDHFVSPFCDSNVRNKRNSKIVLCYCTYLLGTCLLMAFALNSAKNKL